MVIHQFNKLIRNKWVWGVFAIAISAFFAFDFLVADLNRSADEQAARGGAGTLGGEKVAAADFTTLADEIRGFGQQKDWKRDAGEVNRQAWETYAALKVAETDGLAATDADVQAAIRRDPSFQRNGAFSFAVYQLVLRQNGFTPERFEAYLKRRITLSRIGQTVLASAAWASPMEVDQAVADMTDTLTVKVAKFEQTKAEADAVAVDEAGLKKWYEDNKNTLELPERVKVRFVKFNARDPKVLAKMTVSEDEMRDRYDVTADKYTTKDTNGVETVKKFEEVKAEIEKELREIAAVQYFETNLNARVWGVKPAAGLSRLDEIAKEEGLTVETSGWFAADGSYKDGFMKRATSVCPGADGFLEAVAELDSSSEDLRYAVVSSDKAVWLLEKAETSAKHLPDFAEAKEAIKAPALRDAKAEAFKKSVEAVAAKGAAAVTAVKGVSTNLTFSVYDLRQQANAFDNQMAVARAAMSLKKGEVSKFTLTGLGKAILVVCEDRVAGDAAKAIVLKGQMRDELAMLQLRQIPEAWMKWNLDRIGFEPTEISSVATQADAEEE